MRTTSARALLLAGVLAASIDAAASFAQTGQEANGHDQPAQEVSAAHSGMSDAGSRSGNWHAREGMFYQRNWGVDVVGVRPVSSGYMLMFKYRVLDVEKAKPLFDKTIKPYLIDVATGVRLAVPAMENVGELRQSVSPVANRTYFMVFGNPGKLVKSGNQVVVVIGNLRVEGLVVD